MATKNPLDSADSDYAPKLPATYVLLRETYKKAVTIKGKGSEVWCERANALLRMLNALKKDGLLSPDAIKRICEDAAHINHEVNTELDPAALTSQQGSLAMAFPLLQDLLK